MTTRRRSFSPILSRGEGPLLDGLVVPGVGSPPPSRMVRSRCAMVTVSRDVVGSWTTSVWWSFGLGEIWLHLGRSTRVTVGVVMMVLPEGSAGLQGTSGDCATPVPCELAEALGGSSSSSSSRESLRSAIERARAMLVMSFHGHLAVAS